MRKVVSHEAREAERNVRDLRGGAPGPALRNFTTCVAKSSRGTYHVVGVVLIEAALVLISVHKFLVFKRGAPELSARKWAMVALAFLCVAGVVALISVVAFVDVGDKTLHGLLGGVGVGFVLGSCFVALFAGLEQ